jgi:NAD(P)H-hydrate epimerase
LKGEKTLVASPSGRIYVNPTGNSGLGKAGNGDNLAGIIGGFAAQAWASLQSDRDQSISESSVLMAVVSAVYIAGLAGDIAERKLGKRVMIASDVRECLAEAFQTTIE